jgi:hypothetical protein
MPNQTYLPIDELEELLEGAEAHAEGAAGKATVLPFPTALEADTNLNKTILRMKLKRLAVRGTTVTDAAKLLGVHTTTVRNIYQEPDFRKECFGALEEAFEGVDSTLAAASATLEEKLHQQALESFNSLVQMLNTEPLTANQRIKVHQDFMDRAAESAAKRVNINKPSVQADAEALTRAAQAAREMDKALDRKLKRIS